MYANQRRVRGERGKPLLRRRGEFLERPFAHPDETGALRRVHVRGRGEVAKRVLLQAAAFNLALILQSITKAGTRRGLADLNFTFFGSGASPGSLSEGFGVIPSSTESVIADFAAKSSRHREIASRSLISGSVRKRDSDTGC